MGGSLFIDRSPEAPPAAFAVGFFFPLSGGRGHEKPRSHSRKSKQEK
jgi:hypothetical protein